jgi:hypothetical protein
MKTARLIAVGVLCLVTLTSCKPPGGDLPPIPEQVPSATATTESVAIDPPRSILDLPCSALIDEEAISSFFSTAIAPVEPAETITDADHLIPYTFAVQQLGGLACETSNGAPQSAKVTLNPDYRGILLTLMPITSSQFSVIPNYPAGSQVCFDDTLLFCQADSFAAEGWWLSITVTNADGIEGEHAGLVALDSVVTRALAAIATAPPSGATWDAPKGTLKLPVHCEEYLQPTTLADNLQLQDTLELLSPSGPMSVDSLSRQALRARGCVYVHTNTFFGEAYLYWLPGGEWAWQRQSGFESIISSGITPLAVPGLRPEDAAWERCDQEHYCVIDLLVGHNWIELVRDPETKTGVKKHDANLAIATSLYRALRF